MFQEHYSGLKFNCQYQMYKGFDQLIAQVWNATMCYQLVVLVLKVMFKLVVGGNQLRAVLAMMATPLSWKSVFFCPAAKGRFTWKCQSRKQGRQWLFSPWKGDWPCWSWGKPAAVWASQSLLGNQDYHKSRQYNFNDIPSRKNKTKKQWNLRQELHNILTLLAVVAFVPERPHNLKA